MFPLFSQSLVTAFLLLYHSFSWKSSIFIIKIFFVIKPIFSLLLNNKNNILLKFIIFNIWISKKQFSQYFYPNIYITKSILLTKHQNYIIIIQLYLFFNLQQMQNRLQYIEEKNGIHIIYSKVCRNTDKNPVFFSGSPRLLRRLYYRCTVCFFSIANGGRYRRRGICRKRFRSFKRTCRSAWDRRPAP